MSSFFAAGRPDSCKLSEAILKVMRVVFPVSVLVYAPMRINVLCQLFICKEPLEVELTIRPR